MHLVIIYSLFILIYKGKFYYVYLFCVFCACIRGYMGLRVHVEVKGQTCRKLFSPSTI